MKRTKTKSPALAIMLVAILALSMGCKNEITGSDEPTPTKYKLTVKNDSTLSGNFCIYQKFPEQTRPNDVYSLVWLSKSVGPNQKVLF